MQTLLGKALRGGADIALRRERWTTPDGDFIDAWQDGEDALVSVFALTGFMGYTLGPILAMYLTLTNGATLVTLAAGTTAAAFFGLSMIARRTDVFDMLKFGNFLFIGILTAFLLGLGAVFFQIPALSLAVSGLFVLLMSGLIMYETQNILRGGETNYIMATVTLFVSVYNLFTSLLHLLGAFAGEDA